VSYIKPRYINYGNPGLDSSGNSVVVDLSSLPFVEVPKWTYSLTGSYTVPLGVASVRFQLDYAWQADTVISVSQTLNATRTAISSIVSSVRPSNQSLNGRISADFGNGLEVAVFGRNLTNEQFGNFPLALDVSLGVRTLGGSNAPRTFGIEVTKNF
jgi:iron complex outermembrane recepter protein